VQEAFEERKIEKQNWKEKRDASSHNRQTRTGHRRQQIFWFEKKKNRKNDI